ncbi:enoyl-CoA hydratase/isomerase family protein [Tersicoccus sp. MR15.9]|uniref:enoyl-CoA hydratase/isomerase family protein n=1 Tax=Tersicoccus mangrovi TaxID=3121635 RepID=UPI002FE5F39F
MTAPVTPDVDSVTVVEDGSVAVVTFGSGRHHNALSTGQWAALAEVARDLAGRPSLRAVVLRGREGDFCSGSDLREWDGATSDEVDRSFATLEGALRAVEDLPMLTVAVIEGVAAGGGCQLALACDLQLSAASGRIGMPIARLGILIPVTFATRMSVRVGPSRAKDLLYRGRMLPALEAQRIGLITTVVDDDDLDAELAALQASWEHLSAASLRAAKAAVDRGLAPVTGPSRAQPPARTTDPDEFPTRIAAFFHRRRR